MKKIIEMPFLIQQKSLKLIEKKIISRYFNAGGYVFASANEFCSYYKRLDAYGSIYMSHIVYSMLLDGKNFRPFMVNNYRDFNLI